MSKETEIINILTYRLPFDLSRQIYNEYQDRLKEIKYLLDKSRQFNSLVEDLETIKSLLALSIFHKRIISNLDAATKFFSTITRNSDAQSIRIGSYEMTGMEKNSLLAVVISYNKLIEAFGIAPSIMDYNLSKEFLQKLIILKDFDDVGR